MLSFERHSPPRTLPAEPPRRRSGAKLRPLGVVALLAATAAPVPGAAAPAPASSGGAPSAAAEGPATRAERLFHEGVTAAEKGDHDTACARFGESLELLARASTHLNLGTCRAGQGKLATAYRHYQQGMAMLPPGDERIEATTKLLDELSPRVPRLIVTLGPGVPAVAHVLVDGAEVARPELGKLMLDPGKHTIVLTVPEHRDATTDVDLAARDITNLTLSPGEPLAPAKPDKPMAPPEEPSPDLMVPGLAIGAVGLAAAVAAGVTGGVILSKNSTIDDNCYKGWCNDQGYSAVKTNRTLVIVNTISFAVAGAGIGLGAALLIADAVMSGSNEKPTAAVLAPVVVPGGAVLGVTGRF
jgi:hypothetical protein